MRRFDGSFLFVAIITLFIMFFNLGGVPLLDPDEPVYAETPKEMLAFNDFVSPRIYGEYWYDKPPMYYWLVAGSFKMFGINEFAARFPSAVFACLAVFLVYFSAGRLFGRRAGVISALILTTSIEFFYLGKAAVTDSTLNFFLTAALLAFLHRNYYLLYLSAGLATVTKGPVGLLFPGAIIFISMLVTRNFGEIKRMKLPLGVLLFLVVAAPWYYVMYTIHGNAFLDTFIGFHNVTRFTSPEHPEGLLWWYFIPVLIVGFFPWTAILIQSVWSSLTRSNRDWNTLVFLNIWAVFIFLFFTISRTKLVSYILPMFVPMAMIAGWYLDQIWITRRGGRYPAWAAILGCLVLLLCGGLYFGYQAMPHLGWGIVATAAVFLTMGIGVGVFIRQREVARAFWTQVAGMTLFSVILLTLLFPAVAPQFSSKYIAREFAKQYDGKSPVYIIKFLHPGFTFYTGMYGIEVKHDRDSADDLKATIAKSGRAYFVFRQADYEHLNEKERSVLKPIISIEKNLVFLKQE